MQRPVTTEMVVTFTLDNPDEQQRLAVVNKFKQLARANNGVATVTHVTEDNVWTD